MQKGGKEDIAKPGLDILKFWQGIVEIIIRSSIIGLCVILIIATAVGIYHIETNLPGTIFQRVDIQIEEAVNKDYITLVSNAIGASGLGLGISLATFIAESILIGLRFLNFTLINFKIKAFLSIDLTLSVLFAVILSIDTIMAAVTVNDWRSLLSNLEIITELGADTVVRLRDIMTTIAVATVLETLMICFLVVWIIFFLIYNWNFKISNNKVYNDPEEEL